MTSAGTHARNFTHTHWTMGITFGLALCVGLAAFGLGEHAHAENQDSPVPQAAPASVDPIQLGDADFSLRNQNMVNCWRERDRYRQFVLTASRSNDLETAQRAQWVLSRWRRGILASTPAVLVDRLAELTPAQAIEALLAAGQFSAASVAIEEAQSTIELDAITNRVDVLLDSRFPIYARVAVEQQSTEQLLSFLDMAASTKEHAVCRWEWADRMERANQLAPLPASASHWNDEKRVQTEALLLLLKGMPEAAFELASKPISPASAKGDAELETNRLLRLVRMVTRRWDEVATDAFKQTREIENRIQTVRLDQSLDEVAKSTTLAELKNQSVRAWSDVLIAASRADDASLRSHAVESLKAFELADLPSPFDALCWRTLLIHGEVDAALDKLQKQSPRDAALLADSLSRSDQAMSILGYPPSEIDSQLEHWIDEAIQTQQELFAAATSDDKAKQLWAFQQSGSGLCDEIESLLTMIRLLIAVGRDDAALRIAERLSIDELKNVSPKQREQYHVRDHVLNSLSSTSKTDWMAQLAFLPFDEKPGVVPRALMARVSAVDEYRLYPELMQHLTSMRPGLSDRDAFRIACELARADAVDVKKHAEIIGPLALVIKNSMPATVANLENPAVQRQVARARAQRIPTHVWVDLLVAHGRADLAAEYLMPELAAEGNVSVAFELAQWREREVSVLQANAMYQRIWDHVAGQNGMQGNPRDGQEVEFGSTHPEDVMVAVKCVASQYRLMRELGDDLQAEQLLNQLQAMACTPSTDMRQQIAEILADLGHWELAQQLYDSLLLMTAIESDETLSLIDIVRRYQAFVLRATTYEGGTASAIDEVKEYETLSVEDRQRRLDALDWFDLAFAGTLALSDYRSSLYAIWPQLIVRERLELQLGAEMAIDARQIERQLESLQQLNEIDITTAESILPTLTRRGLQMPVQRMLDRLIVNAEKHLTSFPTDAMVANNVAWGVAMNGYRLNDMRDLSWRAVRCQPDSAIYRDTLAEILARLGRTAEAVTIEKACLIDDPGQWHLHEQMTRFSKWQAQED